MPLQVVNGAQLTCSFGLVPSSFVVTPQNGVQAENEYAANIMDYLSMVNIMPFSFCMSPANPLVATATAAALGVLTPQPCQPVTTGPWSPGATATLLAQFPALDDLSVCRCLWAGVITVASPGQVTKQIP